MTAITCRVKFVINPKNERIVIVRCEPTKHEAMVKIMLPAAEQIWQTINDMEVYFTKPLGWQVLFDWAACPATINQNDEVIRRIEAIIIGTPNADVSLEACAAATTNVPSIPRSVRRKILEDKIFMSGSVMVPQMNDIANEVFNHIVKHGSAPMMQGKLHAKHQHRACNYVKSVSGIKNLTTQQCVVIVKKIASMLNTQPNPVPIDQFCSQPAVEFCSQPAVEFCSQPAAEFCSQPAVKLLRYQDETLPASISLWHDLRE
jgi:hypothetical protein